MEGNNFFSSQVSIFNFLTIEEFMCFVHPSKMFSSNNYLLQNCSCVENFVFINVEKLVVPKCRKLIFLLLSWNPYSIHLITHDHASNSQLILINRLLYQSLSNLVSSKRICPNSICHSQLPKRSLPHQEFRIVPHLFGHLHFSSGVSILLNRPMTSQDTFQIFGGYLLFFCLQTK